jgi:hypothetical protein
VDVRDMAIDTRERTEVDVRDMTYIYIKEEKK